MPIPPLDQWGPFRPDIDPAERVARLRTLVAIIHLLTGPRGRRAIDALREAEADPGRLPAAMAALNALEPLDRRRALSSYAVIAEPRRDARPI